MKILEKSNANFTEQQRSLLPNYRIEHFRKCCLDSTFASNEFFTIKTAIETANDLEKKLFEIKLRKPVLFLPLLVLLTEDI